jgi:hypothetical protein
VGSRYLIAALLTTLAAAGCGSAATPPPGPAGVVVTVTRDFGAATLTNARAAPGQSAMNGLRRNADVATAYDGRFVSSINDVKGNTGDGWDWFFFINGIESPRGAADYTLHPGDREWWDYRYWAQYEQVPVVIGAWPEPFVHGFDGRRPQVRVNGLGCSRQLVAALHRAGGHTTTGQTDFNLQVDTFASVRLALAPDQASARGLTVWLQNGVVMLYRGRSGAASLPAARALVVAYRPGDVTGGSASLIVAGANRAAACAAAHTLANDPAAVRSTYAVAMDAHGHVLAAGGRS